MSGMLAIRATNERDHAFRLWERSMHRVVVYAMIAMECGYDSASQDDLSRQVLAERAMLKRWSGMPYQENGTMAAPVRVMRAVR